MGNVAFLEGQTPSGERVALRALDEGDIDRCLKWINDPELRPVLLATFPISAGAERQWLESVTQPVGANPENLVFAIVVDGQHVGNAGIHRISSVHRHAITGLMIGEKEFRGRKIGPTAKRLLIRYAFTELNLETLRADVFEGNAPSIRMQEACGYTLAGRLPRWVFKDGRWKDILLYVLSREDWLRGEQEQGSP